MRLVWGTVTAVVASRDDVQELDVLLDDGPSSRAVNYPRLASLCGLGDRVLLNTTAGDLGLGTGGSHFVVARLGDAKGADLDAPSGGHIMKLRYTPLQVDVVAVESQESPHHEVMKSATTLGETPVVCCGLHSQVALVAAAVKHAAPELRVAYCMSDAAALALPLCDVVRACVAEELLDTTITCGQSFGGSLEAINVYSGLLAARHVAYADVIILGIGPGVVGTATPFGHGGVAQGEALNAAAVVGGTPIAVLRLSFADTRERHRVVSHHSLTALGSVALAAALVPVPSLAPDQGAQVDAALQSGGVWGRHRRVDVEAREESPDLRGIEVKTMGRGPLDDPAFFAAAYAAGSVAARMARKERL